MFNDYVRENLECEFNSRFDYYHELAAEHKELSNESYDTDSITDSEVFPLYIVDEMGNKTLYTGTEPLSYEIDWSEGHRVHHLGEPQF